MSEVGDHVAGGGGLAHLGDGVEIEIVGAGGTGHGVLADPAGENVVAGAAIENVVARHAEQLVGAGVARDGVGRRVACALKRAGAEQGQVLEAGRQRLGDGRFHQIDAPGILQHVGGGIDDKGVVADAANQRIGAGAAIEDIGTGVAGDGVGQPIAGAVDDCGADERQFSMAVKPASVRLTVEVIVSMPPASFTVSAPFSST